MTGIFALSIPYVAPSTGIICGNGPKGVRHGCRLSFAGTGMDCRKTPAEDEERRWSYPDIQFVDIKLAEETGNEILKRIKIFKANQTTESKSNNSELSDKEKIKYLMEELESIKKELKDKQ